MENENATRAEAPRTNGSAPRNLPGGMVAPEAPQLPYPRMPLSQRAKIFIPFDPLKGYREALRAKELEAEAHANERMHIDEAP